jgi:Polyketide cyclase / dehydrase and lipid transport
VREVRHVEASSEIPAPAADLFAYLARLENLASWQSGIVSAQPTSPGEVGVGSSARVVRDLMGQRITADLTVTSFEPARRMGLTSTVGGVRVDALLELASAGPVTDLRFAMEIRATNLFMAPIEGMAADAAARDLADSLERLKVIFTDR